MMSSEPPAAPGHSPFAVVQRRVAEAHGRWKVWKQLYVGDPSNPDDAQERQRLMRSWAPAFFGTLQELLAEDVILRICRLLDDEEGGPKHDRRRNMSLAAAISQARGRGSAEEARGGGGLIDELRKECGVLTVWRNRRIAHDDERVAIGAEGLAAIPHKTIETALEKVVKIMTSLDGSAAAQEYEYTCMIADGDGKSVLYALQCADRYHSECLAKHRKPLA